MNKKTILISLVCSFMAIGCDKKIEQVEPQQEQSVSSSNLNDLTYEERSHLREIVDDAEATSADKRLAQIYTDDHQSYELQEIQDFIANYLAKKEGVAQEQANSDLNLEYIIKSNTSFGAMISPYSLHILSYSDNDIEIDHAEVNRGNCKTTRMKEARTVIGYGEAYVIFLGCDPQTIREVQVYLKDGRSMLLVPKDGN